MNQTDRSLIHKLTATTDNYAGLILRVTLGGVLFPHGAQKVFGWFGGPGFIKEMDHLTHAAGLPAFIAILVILIEFLGALFLLCGWHTRLTAATVAVLFIGIILKVHAGMGFFMNWFGNRPAGVEGFEYHLLVIGICAALIATGSGKYAWDQHYARLKTNR
ncbi:DoxX family protein [Chitinophaga pendula]|uniref:DoxX family protein n=1 Tax=Chitinophaga TaxID=79328 RepID=UPI000BAF3EC9|nr:MULTISPECIES: DoxX family protein [Chitinophaga]ASZ15004.1 hypothetical protein CK934_18320 [Chitinophaga sp. MD30]UCJ09608.1 DoxX family protein [Chitinophaga pendula]